MQTVQLELPKEVTAELYFIRTELENLKLHFQTKQPKTYLSRAEVSKMINVRLLTLNSWNRSGKLKAVGIGKRVLYR
jgi:hypothetical protein